LRRNSGVEPDPLSAERHSTSAPVGSTAMPFAAAVELSLSAAGATPQGHGVAVRFASPVGARTGPDDI